MPRPRFTLRWLMAAVVVVAAALGAEVMRQRRAEFMRNAEVYRYWLDRWKRDVINIESQIGLNVGIEKTPYYLKDHARSTALVDYYRGLVRKYARAARYPWLPVGPDPPPPEPE